MLLPQNPSQYAADKVQASDRAVNQTVKLEESIDKLEGWIEKNNYKGYDPGDGLNSFLRPLTFGNRLAERILLQSVWKAPINFRPFIGIKPMESTKARGYIAAGYHQRYQATGDAKYYLAAEKCLDWLIENQTSRGVGFAWGNHFDFVTRSGKNPAGSPIIVWTSLIGHAFLDAYAQSENAAYLDAATQACKWILELPREKTETGHCLSYVPFAQSSIHNSNMLGAGLLARTWRYTKVEQMLDVAQKAIEYSCERQREDGSWWYGEQDKYHWIDSFHTGYNLDSLDCFIEHSGDLTYKPNLVLGMEYFANTFFEASGVPRYYHNSTNPIDIQCASQGIETLAKILPENERYLQLSLKVANWTIDAMQDPTGYFYYRKYPLLVAKTPYIHWGQATMYKALATLINQRRKHKGDDRAGK